jgi:endonuclease III
MPPKKAAKETASQKRKRCEEERCEKEEKKKLQALMKTSLVKQAPNNPDSAALLELYESLDRFSEEKSALLQRWLQELQ